MRYREKPIIVFLSLILFFGAISFVSADHVPDDFDHDDVPDSEDNCPANFNPRQEDNDDDGVGNACDPDANNPCIPDASSPECVPEPEECPAGQHRDESGACVPDEPEPCPEGEHRDESGVCVPDEPASPQCEALDKNNKGQAKGKGKAKGNNNC